SCRGGERSLKLTGGLRSAREPPVRHCRSRIIPRAIFRTGWIEQIPLAITFALIAAGAKASEAWYTGGDIRTGYVASESRARSGDTSSSDSLRMRLRLHLRGELGGGWHLGARIAGRFDTSQDDVEFRVRTYAPGP